MTYVANEPVFPARSGGTVRIAGMLRELERAFTVELIEPRNRRSSRLRSVLSPRPRLGWATTGAIELARSTGAVTMVSHSYLAPMLIPTPQPLVVDFANIETDRQATAIRGLTIDAAVSAIEWAKGHWWERQVARRAAVSIAVAEADAERLRSWGAPNVLVVPNAATHVRSVPSPSDGPVGVVASAGYAPNTEALRWLVTAVWPRVRAARPTAQLHIAGLGTEELRAQLNADGVTILGTVDDVAAFYDSCSVVAAPVQRGAGSQLKVVEALARSRVVVATPHSAAPFMGGMAALLELASGEDAFATAIVGALRDVEGRHRRERTIGDAVPTWEKVCSPLIEAIDRLAPPGGGGGIDRYS